MKKTQGNEKNLQGKQSLSIFKSSEKAFFQNSLSNTKAKSYIN